MVVVNVSLIWDVIYLVMQCYVLQLKIQFFFCITHTHTHTHATSSLLPCLTPHREQILKNISRQELMKQHYAEELTKATSEQKQYNPQSLEVSFVDN